MTLTGQLTHTSGDKSGTNPVKEVDVDFDDLDMDERAYLLQTGEVPSDAGRTVQMVVQQEAPDPVVEPEPQTGPDRFILNTRVLPSEPGFYYRVQIIAVETAFDAKTLFRSEGVDREVMVEEQDGMYKYTVGSFRDYNEVDAYRSRMEGFETVDGPFVVAYRDGRRVPVPLTR